MNNSILFVVLLLFILTSITTSKRQTRHNNNNISQIDKIWRNKKSECQSSTCSRFPFHEGYNCVNECVSSKCYQSVYAKSPLEDGEIDVFRDRQFAHCVRSEQKERNLLAGMTFNGNGNTMRSSGISGATHSL
jgi:hypothetical protein